MEKYWQRYGLAKSPFAYDHHEKAYFSLPRWEQRIEFLIHLSKYSGVLLVMTGGSGSGKSMFLQHFLDYVEDTIDICELIADPALDIAQLSDTFGEEFGVNCAYDPDMSADEYVQILVAELQQSGQSYFLAIDDAHHLPSKSLEFLLKVMNAQMNALAQHNLPLHIMLVGDDQLAQNIDELARELEEEEIVHALELEPFLLEDTKHYLFQRFKAVGLQKEFPLTEAMLSYVQRESGGNPRKINLITEQIMVDEFNESKGTKIMSFAKQHKVALIGAGILLALLIIISFYATDNSKLTKQTQTKHSATVSMVSETIDIPTQTTQSANIPQSNSFAEQTRQQVPANIALPATAVDNQPAQASQTQAQPQTQTQTQTNMTHYPLAQGNAGISGTRQAQHLQPQNQQAASSAAQQHRPVIEIDPVGAVDDATPTSKVTAQQPVTAEKPTAAPVQPQTQQQPKTKFAAVTQRSLLRANKNAYTIQIIGVHNRAKLQEFIKQQQLGSQATYYKTSRQGKNWYVLVFGQYPSAQAARAAIKDLPVAVQQLNPWIRPLSSVQEALGTQQSG